LAADRQCRPHRLSGVHGLAGGGGTGGDAAVSAAGELEEPYLTYNELQDSQGFDLSACCGKQVARYTYTVTNYPGRPEGVQANLYVCEGQPVAGDILCAGADGFQDTLVYPEQD